MGASDSRHGIEIENLDFHDRDAACSQTGRQHGDVTYHVSASSVSIRGGEAHNCVLWYNRRLYGKAAVLADWSSHGS